MVNDHSIFEEEIASDRLPLAAGQASFPLFVLPNLAAALFIESLFAAKPRKAYALRKTPFGVLRRAFWES